MSKRRLDGSVVVASRRRKRDEDIFLGCKRGRFAEPPVVECLGKRKAFESELDSMHKRLRTMPPRCTPEQVVAVLLPHLLRLQSVYVQEQQRSAQLQSNNNVLASAVKRLNESNMALKWGTPSRTRKPPNPSTTLIQVPAMEVMCRPW